MEPEPQPIDLSPVLQRVVQGAVLAEEEARTTFDAIMEGRVAPVQIAGLLAAMQARGVAPSEVAGGVRSLRRAMIPVPCDRPDEVVDTCGTGGGGLVTFNVSTAAALVAAGAGVRIAKHGNRSFTSRSGSADVLEALGVRIDLSAERMAEVLRDAGIVFMFAPLLHPAMRHVGPVRRELRIPTIMNLLGPLTNPAGAARQVVGVSARGMLDLVARALQTLGHRSALVVHGAPGMDEISPLGPTEVVELERGELRRYVLEPGDVGEAPGSADEIRGGSPEENATTILDVLAGGGPPTARAFTILNAAAAIRMAADEPLSWADAAEQARRSIDGGGAAGALNRLRDATHRPEADRAIGDASS